MACCSGVRASSPPVTTNPWSVAYWISLHMSSKNAACSVLKLISCLSFRLVFQWFCRQSKHPLSTCPTAPAKIHKTRWRYNQRPTSWRTGSNLKRWQSSSWGEYSWTTKNRCSCPTSSGLTRCRLRSWRHPQTIEVQPTPSWLSQYPIQADVLHGQTATHAAWIHLLRLGCQESSRQARSLLPLCLWLGWRWTVASARFGLGYRGGMRLLESFFSSRSFCSRLRLSFSTFSTCVLTSRLASKISMYNMPRMGRRKAIKKHAATQPIMSSPSDLLGAGGTTGKGGR